MSEPQTIDVGPVTAGDIAAAPITRRLITKPGVYDLAPDEYHRDPVKGGSLSNSGAKLMLDAPARFHYRQTHPEPYKAAFDEGTAAHHEVLGIGEEIVEVAGSGKDPALWNTNETKALVAELRAAGKVPVKPGVLARVQGMARELRSNKATAKVLVPGQGLAERAHIWYDPEFGIWRRSLVDYKTYLPDGRVVIVDYKTTASARPGSIRKSVYNFGYHLQDAFYSAGVEILDGVDEVEFLFVFQEKEPPYLCTVVQLEEEARQWGRVQIRKAMELYVQCRDAGEWPGYMGFAEQAERPLVLGLPGWAENELEAAWQLPPTAAGSLRVVEDI